MFGLFRRLKRPRLLAAPLPSEFWTMIDRRVPMARSLNAADRIELGGIVNVLLAEKTFEGCAGLVITDEIRVTIAAQAAMLLLHRKTDFYPTLRTILVYPKAFLARVRQQNPDGTVSEGAQPRLGESWFRGSLVLSWDDVIRGSADESDGRNVVLHEFAHQLDGEWGGMDGAPGLPSAGRFRDWARVLGHEYAQLVRELHQGQPTLLGSYAASNPAEFFAVATELFFERPAAMFDRHPELYKQLAAFYLQDPR